MVAVVLLFVFSSNYSTYIIKIVFPAAANSQNVLPAAIVANRFLSAATL